MSSSWVFTEYTCSYIMVCLHVMTAYLIFLSDKLFSACFVLFGVFLLLRGLGHYVKFLESDWTQILIFYKVVKTANLMFSDSWWCCFTFKFREKILPSTAG